jgi:anti-sigma factor RsiW
MKTIDDLTLQAYVDGELSARHAAVVEEALRQNPRAAALVEELRMTRRVLTANEPEAKLPESLDFHWSKIAREIERMPAPAAAVWSWSAVQRWLRFAVPAGAVAALALLLIVQPGNRPAEEGDFFTEPAAEISPLVFQSHDESMTVIWLQGEENSGFANPEDNF